MFGAIIGDMIGSPYEFSYELPPKNCKIFKDGEHFTDDTVMTVAVASALMKSEGRDDDILKKNLIQEMHNWGNKYPNAGYGRRFCQWLIDREQEPYGSFANGSAMRVSSAGWLYSSLRETRRIARITAEVTHNHPEGIKGAEAVASAIYLARNDYGKDVIKEFMQEEFGYELPRSIDQIRSGDRSPSAENVSCKKTVPEAIFAFLSGNNFSQVMRAAVSMGGDTDTIAAIAGSVAEGYFKIPKSLIFECEDRLPNDMLYVVRQFQARSMFKK